MTPCFCRVKHNPPETYGDCWRACIATMLDIERPEDVPHFAEDGCSFEESIKRIRAFLAPHNAYLTHFSAELQHTDVLAFMAERNPDIDYLLCSENHVVVCRNDQIVHDPAWYRTSLTQPSEAWTVLVITK